MDGPSPEEGTARHLIIEAPEVLDPNTNLLDQEPFGRILDVTGRRTQIPRELLEKMLFRSVDAVKLGQEGDASKTAYLDLRTVKPEEIDSISAKAAELVDSDGSYQNRGQNTGVISAMLYVLNKYPYWMSYIDAQRLSRYQRHTGNPNLSYKTGLSQQVEVPSYAAWATDKLRRERLLKTKGIEEVFSQDAASTTTDATPRKSRKWALLHSSELVK